MFPSITFPQYSQPPPLPSPLLWDGAEAGGPRPPITSLQTGPSRDGSGGRPGAGRWCLSFFFNIYLINQLPTARCGGVELLHRCDLLVQDWNVCVLGSHVSIVPCCVLPSVLLLALLGRLFVRFLFQCSFNRASICQEKRKEMSVL